MFVKEVNQKKNKKSLTIFLIGLNKITNLYEFK